MVPISEPNLTPAELADITQLADGSLDPRRRAEVESWIRSSPEGQAAYRRERVVVELLRQARATDRAPDRLRRRIERERGTARRSGGRLPIGFGFRLGFSATLAAAVAAAIVVIALALPGGSPGSPSVAQAAALALAGPTQPAPKTGARNPDAALAQGVHEIYFPSWSSTLGWRAVGERRDRLGGRTAITVYYASHGTLVAYTILGTPALPQPSATPRRVHGLELRTLSLGGRTVVTWRRAGHTCVISARGVPVAVLQRLAASR